MNGRLPDRDHAAVEALVADRYLDDLLAAADRRADDAPVDALLDPELREAARVLRRSLVRIHPSFRFEERLAARLSELAATRPSDLAADQGHPMAAAGNGAPVPFTGRGTPSALGAADPLLPAILSGSLDPADDAAVEAESRLATARRPLLVGGAITSAAISLVGVAWVAWRAARPTRPAAGAPAGASGRMPAATLARAVGGAPARHLAGDGLPGAAAGVAAGTGGRA